MISSEILKNSFISGAENIAKHTAEVNSINVFPVPDGDTGTNLSLTLTGCAEKIKHLPEMAAGELADRIAGELFRSARGNSGVIFSLIFKGFAQSVKDLEFIDALSLAKGLEAGCNEAYSAIDKPMEGTILTVIRLAASKAISAASKGKSAQETFIEAVNGARVSLKSTPNLLPMLKKHGFVDAGGQGLVYIMEGMLESQKNITFIKTEEKKQPVVSDSEIKFIYCTEFLINGSNNADLKLFRNFLSEIGDCPAVAEHSGIIKVHVHTNDPDKAIGKALELGELSDVKIDNMRLQNQNGANQWNSTQASNI
ncbi:MAG: DAK2 domain-containing protein [Ruminococcaceae bacterium]|nr:DAK2 domain-containing protein [Oscillospiraceae bacterium]